MTEETKDTFAEKVTLEVLFEVSGCALLIIAYPTPPPTASTGFCS